MPGVVEQNESFIYALRAAPNVLYANYKQYGQVRDPFPSVSRLLEVLTSSLFKARRARLVCRIQRTD